MKRFTRIEFFRHGLGNQEKESVGRILDSLMLTTGDATAQAERALEDYLGVAHVVCVNSCTAALHLALTAQGIGPGDEVIVPAMTFIATANAVVMSGATPVLADVDPNTGCLTPETVGAQITSRTRAVIPVHLYGLLCDMEALADLAEQRGLIIVEDAAHCLEARRGCASPGTHSSAACFSFYATKSITCGEGGALATNDAQLAATVRRQALHGMSAGASERWRATDGRGKRYEHWDMPVFGWKYNLDNIRAALLLPQIARIDERCARRRYLARRYDAALCHVSGIDAPEVPEKQWSARHLYTIWVSPERRDDTLAQLQERGVGVAVNYRPVHWMGYYRKRLGHGVGDFPVADWIGARTVSLPLYPSLTEEEQDYVVECLIECVGGRGGDAGSRSRCVDASSGSRMTAP